MRNKANRAHRSARDAPPSRTPPFFAGAQIVAWTIVGRRAARDGKEAGNVAARATRYMYRARVSARGHVRTSARSRPMSAFAAAADIGGQAAQVSFGSEAEVGPLERHVCFTP